MINAFEVLINFYQGIIIIYYCDKFFSGKRNWALAALCTVIAGLFLSAHQFFSLPIPDTLVFLVGYVYLYYTKRSNFWGRLFCCILLTAVWIATSTIFIMFLVYILKMDLDVIFGGDKSRILCLISINALITVLIFSICNLFRKHQFLRIPISCSLLFIALLFAEWMTAEFLFSYFLQNDNSDNRLFILIIVTLFFIIVLSIILYDYFCAILSHTMEAENTARMLRDSLKQQGEMKRMYKVMLKNQHDFKHRIAVAEAMLKTCGAVSEEKLKALLMEDEQSQNVFLTGNELVDAMLTVKKETALSYGISFRYQPYPLNRLPIDETSFCILINNLLDNAIQELAVCKNNHSDCYIDIKFSRNMDMFFISCINPMSIEQKNISRETVMKKQYSGHGYGLESIRNTVEKNKGVIQITSKNYMFRVDIMLPMEDDKKYDGENQCGEDNSGT